METFSSVATVTPIPREFLAYYWNGFEFILIRVRYMGE